MGNKLSTGLDVKDHGTFNLIAKKKRNHGVRKHMQLTCQPAGSYKNDFFKIFSIAVYVSLWTVWLEMTITFSRVERFVSQLTIISVS